MILRDRDRTVDPCCDNVVGLVFGDLWPAIIFILFCDGSAWTWCPRWPRSSTRTTSLHGFTKRDCVNKFFVTEGNKKILIHKEKSCFPFSATAHRDFERAVLDFCSVQSLSSLAEAKISSFKYSPLILQLQVTFTKRLSFKATFKGHSIIMYLKRRDKYTKPVSDLDIKKTTCCVQLNIVLWDRVKLNFTEILKADTLR